jgi:hypothetical protein
MDGMRLLRIHSILIRQRKEALRIMPPELTCSCRWEVIVECLLIPVWICQSALKSHSGAMVHQHSAVSHARLWRCCSHDGA